LHSALSTAEDSLGIPRSREIRCPGHDWLRFRDEPGWADEEGRQPRKSVFGNYRELRGTRVRTAGRVESTVGSHYSQ
jgi:hypothetical protein